MERYFDIDETINAYAKLVYNIKVYWMSLYNGSMCINYLRILCISDKPTAFIFDDIYKSPFRKPENACRKFAEILQLIQIPLPVNVCAELIKNRSTRA